MNKVIAYTPGYSYPDLTLASLDAEGTLNQQLAAKVLEVRTAEQKYRARIDWLARKIPGGITRQGEFLEVMKNWMAFSNTAIREADESIETEATYLRIMIGKGEKLLRNYTLAGSIVTSLGWENDFTNFLAQVINMHVWPLKKVVEPFLPEGEVKIQPVVPEQEVYTPPAPELPGVEEQKIPDPSQPSALSPEQENILSPKPDAPPVSPEGWRKYGVLALAGIVGIILLSEFGKGTK